MPLILSVIAPFLPQYFGPPNISEKSMPVILTSIFWSENCVVLELVNFSLITDSWPVSAMYVMYVCLLLVLSLLGRLKCLASPLLLFCINWKNYCMCL